MFLFIEDFHNKSTDTGNRSVLLKFWMITGLQSNERIIIAFCLFLRKKECSLIGCEFYTTVNMLKPSNCRIKMMANIPLNAMNVIITNKPHFYIFICLYVISKKIKQINLTYMKVRRCVRSQENHLLLQRNCILFPTLTQQFATICKYCFRRI